MVFCVSNTSDVALIIALCIYIALKFFIIFFFILQ
jgi:hypothetical protein